MDEIFSNRWTSLGERENKIRNEMRKARIDLRNLIQIPPKSTALLERFVAIVTLLGLWHAQKSAL